MKWKYVVFVTGLVVMLGLSGCDDYKANGGKVYDVQAVADRIEVDAGESIVIAVLDNDKATSEEDGIVVDEMNNLELDSITRQPVHGTATKDGNTIVYVHDGSTVTTDSFKYKAVLFERSDEASVLITVNQPDVPLANQAPAAEAGVNKTVQSGESVTITGSGTDNDGSIVSYKWEKGATQLATTAEFTYSPTEAGIDTLKLTVTDDDGATASDEMNVTVTEAPNSKPVANDASITMAAECEIGRAVSFILTGSDEDAGDTLTFSKVTDPTYGSVVLEGDGHGEFRLDDSEDQNKCLDGMANSFTFKVNDATEDSEVATVTISSD